MKLLAVPLVIAAAGSIITGQIQREANQNAVLKAYFDKLEELTFERNLLAETPDEGAIVLARGRTVAALHELDLSRRTQLIAFLQASGLSRIDADSAEPVISFKDQNLAGLDLRQISLFNLDFERANLWGAYLTEADLLGADLTGATLVGANLTRAGLVGANLQGAFLVGANLTEADLWGAYLAGALMADALTRAFLKGARLEGASLDSANLTGASLAFANLTGANLDSANLTGANLNSTNLTGAVHLTPDQLALAKLCRTTLPEGITLDPNRDCEELGIDPETGEDIGP
jgi:uncharacterized protein YjbI with pentapeptide repeats